MIRLATIVTAAIGCGQTAKAPAEATSPVASTSPNPSSETATDATSVPPVSLSGLPADVKALFQRDLAFPLDYATSFTDPVTSDGDVEPYSAWKSKVTCRVSGLRRVGTAWVSTHTCTTNPAVPENLGADYKALERPSPAFTETYVATENGFWLAHWPAADDEDIEKLISTTPLVKLPVTPGYDGAIRVTRRADQAWCVQNMAARISYLCVHPQRGIVNRVRRGSDHVTHDWVNWGGS